MGADDRQVGGNHYKKYGDYQPWKIIDVYGFGYYEGVALEYLLRHREKGGIESLEKCIHVLEKLIELKKKNAEKAVVNLGQLLRQKLSNEDTQEKEVPWGIQKYVDG